MISYPKLEEVRRICSGLDLNFQGIQDDSADLFDLEPLVLFSESLDATTLALPISKFTPNAVVARLEQAHARERSR